MPLLLQTALGFWGMRYVHFPQAYLTHARFEVVKVVLLEISVLWDMTPRRMEYRYQRFERGFGPHLQGRTSYLACFISFLDTEFGCIMTVRWRTTIIIIKYECGCYTSSYL